MTIHDRLTATIKNRLPSLRDSEVDALVKDIEGAGLVAQEWTPVTERDPEPGRYLICFSVKGGRNIVDTGVFDDEFGWTNGWPRDVMNRLLAYQPLPNAPTDQTKGERG